MKRIIYLFLCFSLFFKCFCDKPLDGYIISINVKNKSGYDLKLIANNGFFVGKESEYYVYSTDTIPKSFLYDEIFASNWTTIKNDSDLKKVYEKDFKDMLKGCIYGSGRKKEETILDSIVIYRGYKRIKRWDIVKKLEDASMPCENNTNDYIFCEEYWDYDVSNDSDPMGFITYDREYIYVITKEMIDRWIVESGN